MDRKITSFFAKFEKCAKRPHTLNGHIFAAIAKKLEIDEKLPRFEKRRQKEHGSIKAYYKDQVYETYFKAIIDEIEFRFSEPQLEVFRLQSLLPTKIGNCNFS